MNKQSKAVTVASTAPVTVENFIVEAIRNNVSADTMQKLFDLQKDVKAEKAKEEFNKAMSELQGELPVIKKLKAGHVAKFAPLEDIQEVTKDIIKEHGFSYRWNTSQTDKNIKVTCIATHILGHSESTDMISEVEEVVTGNTSGKSTKSAPQRAASTITFLKRYTFVNMFGITVAGEDFDGRMEKQKPNKMEPKPIDVKAAIMVNLKRLGVDISKKEEIKEHINRLTGVIIEEKTSDKTFEDINSELEMLVTKKYNEDNNI